MIFSTVATSVRDCFTLFSVMSEQLTLITSSDVIIVLNSAGLSAQVNPIVLVCYTLSYHWADPHGNFVVWLTLWWRFLVYDF